MPATRAIMGKRFYLVLLLIGIASFAAHEFAHWAMGVALGHDMLASPNHVWAKGHVSVSHQMMISAAGPGITIILGLFGFLLVRYRASLAGFALLYMAFFSRLLAGAVSILNPNDEARISVQLGLGLWTLPIVTVLTLFLLTWMASVRLNLTVRDQFFCYVVASVSVTIVVAADRLFFVTP